MKIRVDAIEVGERLRSINPGAVDQLRVSLNDIGLQHPIKVMRCGERFKLVAGHHRLEAARQLGWFEIEVSVVDLSGMSEDEAKHACLLIEVDENLYRSELTIAERVLFVGMRVELTSEKILRERVRKSEESVGAATAEHLAALQQRRAAIGAVNISAANAFVASTSNTKRAARKRLHEAQSALREHLYSASFGSRAVAGAADEVARSMRLRKRVVQELLSYRNKIGKEALQLFALSKVGNSKKELDAFVELKRIDAPAAEKMVAEGPELLKKGIAYTPSSILKATIKQRSYDACEQAKSTDDGRLNLMFDNCNDARRAMGKALAAYGKLSNEKQHTYKSIEKVAEQLDALISKLKGEVRPEPQPRTGTEWRYAGDSIQ